MGYYTGTANDLEALRQAIFTACTGEGWTLAGDVLHKDGLYARLQVVSGSLRLLGGTGIDGSHALTGAAGNYTQIGGLGIVYPLTYELFLFASEVYVVVNYAVDRYQWCAWGRTTVQGVGGSGIWFGASQSSELRDSITILLASGSVALPCAALFWYSYTGARTQCFYIHHGLDGGGWAAGSSLVGASDSANDLLTLLPNTWNSEAVLIPARLFLVRPSYKCSLVAESENFRHTRIDNYTPGQVITIGSDRWKVLPWHRKNSAGRNGGIQIDHSGTFGWAIRYEGP